MATEIFVDDPQSQVEIRKYFCDFAPDLPTGVTVASATATHVPPSGAATVPVVNIALAPVVTVTLGPVGAVQGEHRLSVVATLSDGEKSEILLHIPVHF